MATVNIIELRRATMADAERLLLWRNDEVAVRMSKSGRPIEAEEHRAWLLRALQDTSWTRIFIATTKGGPVGNLRLDKGSIDGACAVVSIVVAPRERGKGYGWQILDLGIHEARRMGCKEVRAAVKSSNLPSRRIFTGAGFTIVSNPVNEWLDYWRAL